MADDLKAVLARLPAFVPHHPVKMKEIRAQWDQGCSKILASAHLKREERIQVTMLWLNKSGIRDYVLGNLVHNWARPLPNPPTDEQKKERRQKTFVRLAYTDDIPHLRAVNKVVTGRLEEPMVQSVDIGSLATIDAVDDREKETPGAMFAQFAKSIEYQLELDYKSKSTPGTMFDDAAE